MLSNEEILALGPLPDKVGETVAELICRLIESDPHSWSSRPCQTCNQVSTLLGRPFGCQRKQK